MSNPHIDGLWNDLRLLSSARTTGSAVPSLEIVTGGLRAWRFAANATNELFLSAQLPHTYKEGSDIKLHVHWGHASGTDNGAVVWQAEWTWANNNAAIPAATTSASAADSVLAAEQNFVLPHDIVTMTGTGKKVSSILLIRLFRDPTHVSDTSTADVFLYEADLHYQEDACGTVNEWSKP